jgi:hypothetical protein
MYSAEWHQIPLESDPVLVVDGQVAKVRNYSGPLKPNLIEVVVSDYERIFQKSPTEFLKLAKFRGGITIFEFL